MAQSRPVLVDPGAITIEAELISGLPVVNAVLERLGLAKLLVDHLPEPDPRCELTPAQAIGVLVRNLALGRQPLYGLCAWAADYDPTLLGLQGGEAELLKDDRVGRALDQLFFSDRASLLTALSLSAIDAFGIALEELHDDSTSLVLYGAYADATGAPRAGVSPPRPARGFSKDHRGDLKQLVWILTISADGAVPITYRMVDGNVEDSTTHITTWERCRAVVCGPHWRIDWGIDGGTQWPSSGCRLAGASTASLDDAASFAPSAPAAPPSRSTSATMRANVRSAARLLPWNVA